MTHGELLVGVSFNPSGNDDVDAVKAGMARLIDLLHEKREAAIEQGRNEAVRHYAIAITEAQTAQMWAVKALTFKES